MNVSELVVTTMRPTEQTGESLPAGQEAWAQVLCQEDLLEKEMATHSSILAWRIPWPWDGKESDTTEQLHFHFRLSGWDNRL